jgi:hypothetical protein
MLLAAERKVRIFAGRRGRCGKPGLQNSGPLARKARKIGRPIDTANRPISQQKKPRRAYGGSPQPDAIAKRQRKYASPSRRLDEEEARLESKETSAGARKRQPARRRLKEHPSRRGPNLRRIRRR